MTPSEDASPQPAQWHLKKEIQLGHLITTLTIGASVAAYVLKMEQRIALVEQQVTQQHERDARQDDLTNNDLTLLRHQLEKLDSKLDRLNDKLDERKSR